MSKIKEFEIDELTFGEDLQAPTDNKPVVETKETVVSQSDFNGGIDVDENSFEEPELEVTETKESKGKSSKEIEDNPLAIFAKQLHEDGFLDEIEELPNIEDSENLAELLNEQLNKKHQKWQDEYKQDMINNLVKEGLISKDSVNTVKEYTKEDLENESKAKEFLTERFKEKGFNDKQIKKMLDKSLDITEDALDMYEDYEVSKDKRQKETLAKIEKDKEVARKQAEEFNNNLQKSFYDFNEFLPGKKINKKTQEKLLNKIPDTLNKVNSNLPKYMPILTYLDDIGVLDGKLDILLQAGETKATDRLSEVLKAKKPATSGYSKKEDIEGDALTKVALASLKRK